MLAGLYADRVSVKCAPGTGGIPRAEKSWLSNLPKPVAGRVRVLRFLRQQRRKAACS
jgi:hypothetical protein